MRICDQGTGCGTMDERYMCPGPGEAAVPRLAPSAGWFLVVLILYASLCPGLPHLLAQSCGCWEGKGDQMSRSCDHRPLPHGWGHPVLPPWLGSPILGSCLHLALDCPPTEEASPHGSVHHNG